MKYLNRLSFILAGCGDQDVELGNTYLIRVGDSVVTALDFNKAFEITKMAYPHNTTQDPAFFREARLRLLHQMIEELIVLESAKELGIQVSDTELEKAISDIKGEFPEGVFEKMLLENAISRNYWKKRLKTRLLMKKVISKEVGEQIRITPEDVSMYYDEFFKGSAGEEPSVESSKDTDKMVIDHLRWKKTEAAYTSWIKERKQKQAVEINEMLWKKIVNS
ncbi:SurA N-terminal domain-containing protein [Thermodesulfobacteriota bacterium]